jgi:hypothetical protein
MFWFTISKLVEISLPLLNFMEKLQEAGIGTLRTMWTNIIQFEMLEFGMSFPNRNLRRGLPKKKFNQPVVMHPLSLIVVLCMRSKFMYWHANKHFTEEVFSDGSFHTGAVLLTPFFYLSEWSATGKWSVCLKHPILPYCVQVILESGSLMARWRSSTERTSSSCHRESM